MELPEARKFVFKYINERGQEVDSMGLTAYHYERNEEARKAVVEMMKNPLTKAEARENMKKKF